MASTSSAIIIGAGAAGLAAALELRRHNVNVLILEARGRTGGRIFTLHPANGNFPIELGAEFIHGDASEIMRIVNQQDIKKLSEKHQLLWQDQTMNIDSFWKKADRLLKSLTCHKPDRPMAQFIEASTEDFTEWERAMFINYIEGFNAADVFEMSECALANEDASIGIGDNSRLIVGFDSLFDAVHRLQTDEEFELLLNCRVNRVEWRPGEVKVISETEKGERADFAFAAIVTLPVSLLSAETVAFAPAIKEKTLAAARIQLGPVYKTVFQFKEPLISTSKDIEFFHTPDSSYGTRWIWGLYDARVVTSWSGGSRTRRFQSGSKDELVDVALRELAKTLKRSFSELQTKLEAAEIHNWQTDPFARGSYSYVKTGGEMARDVLAQPMDKTLYFAGEATMSDGSAGTVPGALRSGVRAAKQFLAAYLVIVLTLANVWASDTTFCGKYLPCGRFAGPMTTRGESGETSAGQQIITITAAGASVLAFEVSDLGSHGQSEGTQKLSLSFAQDGRFIVSRVGTEMYGLGVCQNTNCTYTFRPQDKAASAGILTLSGSTLNHSRIIHEDGKWRLFRSELAPQQ